MRDDEIDRALAETWGETGVSPGFSDRVMKRVRVEVASPGPIPFPWTRALPGLAAAATGLAWAGAEIARWIARTNVSSGRIVALPADAGAILELAVGLGAGLAVSGALLAASRRLVSRRLA